MRVVRALSRMLSSQSGIIWLIAAALLFLIGAIANGAAGSRELTEIGVIGAVVAIAFVAAFMA
jgi:hypothetical protein